MIPEFRIAFICTLTLLLLALSLQLIRNCFMLYISEGNKIPPLFFGITCQKLDSDLVEKKKGFKDQCRKN